jgi:hypothetical protein
MFICDWKPTELGVVAVSLLIPDMSQVEGFPAEQKEDLIRKLACLGAQTGWFDVRQDMWKQE